MKYALGIDPSVSDLSIGLWGPKGPVEVMVVHIPRKRVTESEQSQVRMARALHKIRPAFAIATAVAIEGQQVDGRGARPADLFTLAHTTGAALAWCVQNYPEAHIMVPTPTEWKGQVAKYAHQARLFKDLGWDYTLHGTGKKRYARPVSVPLDFQHVTGPQWKDAADALLLARWAYDQLP